MDDNVSQTPAYQVYAPGHLKEGLVQLRADLLSLRNQDYEEVVKAFEPIRSHITMLHRDPNRPQLGAHNYIDWFYDYFGNRIFASLMALDSLDETDAVDALKRLQRVSNAFDESHEWFRLLRMDFEFSDIQDEEKCRTLQSALLKLDVFEKKINTLQQHIELLAPQIDRVENVSRSIP